MPTKKRAARATRSEQLPDAATAIQTPRTDWAEASGTWEIDVVIDRMVARGIYNHVAPPKSVRWQVREAVLNADVAARSVYRHRDTAPERECEAEAWSNVLAAFQAYADNLGVDQHQIDQLASAIVERQARLDTRPPTMTRDFFADSFVSQMLFLWNTIASVKIERPHGALFEELVTAAWIDGRCPGWNDDRDRLHARLAKRVAARRKVWSQDHRGN